jgi:hypothetical protein
MFGIIPIVVVLLVLVKVMFGPERRNKFWVAFGLGMALLVLLGWANRFHTHFSGWPRLERSSRAQVHSPPLPPAVRTSGVRGVRPATGPATQTSWLWVNDWSAFVSSTNFNGFRAESSDSCPTDSESRREAIADATRGLTQIVQAHPRLTRPLGRGEIERQITAALQEGSLIQGRYVHRTDKSYGSLYKTYLLVDTSPARLDPLVKRLNQQISAQRRQTLTAAGSTAATILVVLLLYAFLNTVTKGYFVWKLRAAALLMMIAAVMVAAVMI